VPHPASDVLCASPMPEGIKPPLRLPPTLIFRRRATPLSHRTHPYTPPPTDLQLQPIMDSPHFMEVVNSTKPALQALLSVIDSRTYHANELIPGHSDDPVLKPLSDVLAGLNSLGSIKEPRLLSTSARDERERFMELLDLVITGLDERRDAWDRPYNWCAFRVLSIPRADNMTYHRIHGEARAMVSEADRERCSYSSWRFADLVSQGDQIQRSAQARLSTLPNAQEMQRLNER
jgi:hypothetical protein